MKHRLFYTLALLFATLQTFAQTYTYDNLNRLTKVVYGNGVTVIYGYDALGNRISKKVTGVSFSISVAVSPSRGGSVTGDGTYSSGTTVELKAIPNEGYEFEKWSDGETDNPRNITVTKDLSLTAQFKEITAVPDIPCDIIDNGKGNFKGISDSPIYNTSGQRIIQTTKEIYIQNGKKYKDKD